MAYITKDEFLKFSGKDLDLEFKNGNYDIKDPVPMFIEKVETAAIAFLKRHFDNYGFKDKVEANKEEFKKGMLWQVDYILEHGELYNDPDINSIKSLSPMARTVWTNIGLCNIPRFRRC